MTRMRLPAFTGVALIALVAGVLLWNREPGRSERAHSGARAPTRQDAAAQVAEFETGATTEIDDVNATIEVRGSVVVEAQDGGVSSAESGTMRLETGYWPPIRVVVAGGVWCATVHDGEAPEVSDVRLGGRKAIVDPETIELPEDGLVEVRCRWFEPTLLRVLGEKGQDLEGVEIVDDYSAAGDIVPGPEVLDDRVLPEYKRVRLGNSPVTLPEDPGTQTYWVRARDHAWARITVSVGFGGERVVRLVRGGLLDVRLLPFEPGSSVKLHLYRQDVHLLDWLPDEAGSARIEALPPGRFEVRAVIGEVGREWLCIANAHVEIEAGLTTKVELSLHTAPPLPQFVPLAGTLHVDPGWDEQREPARICGTEEDGIRIIPESSYIESRVEEYEEGAWSADDVAPGRYLASVGPWMWTQLIDVGPRGNTDVRLVVPPPCDVEVRLLDAETGEAIADESGVEWYVTSPGIPSRYYFRAATQTAASPGIYRFRAPIGTLVVRLWSEIHDAELTEAVLKPGLNRVDLKAVPRLSIDLALKDGAMPVPVDVAFSDGVQITALDSDGELEDCGTGDPFRVWVTKPGRYGVSFPVLIEGYEPIAPVEVEFVKGRIARAELHLKRREP